MDYELRVDLSPLFDLLQQGKQGDDRRFYLSWYGADWSTDPQAHALDPEHRANPSLASFATGYLAQQQRRLPSHVYRRLHLNLPGLPAGAAFTAEMIGDAITRGVRVRPPVPGLIYYVYLDPSGGSSDAFTLGISHQDDGRGMLDGVWDQGAATPFNPRHAVGRFAGILKQYGVSTVVGDKYAGETFIADFAVYGITYIVAALAASDLYAAIEPHLNAGQVGLVDDGMVEQQLLGLVWRGKKIDHPSGEHDDHANAAVGAVLMALQSNDLIDTTMTDDEAAAIRRMFTHPGDISIDADDVVGNFLDPYTARW